MFGFLFGVVVTLGVTKYLRYRRGEGGFGPPWGFARRRPRWFLQGLFERLNTLPSQERAIEGALENVFSAARRVKEERHRLPQEVARIFRAPTVDSSLVEQAFARQRAAFDEVKKAVSEGLAQVHGTLDERQRMHLAELLEEGDYFDGGCGWRSHRRDRHWGRGPDYGLPLHSYR